MSTYIYLECLDHSPPLRAGDESGQHLTDLDRIKEEVKNRDYLVKLFEDSAIDYYGAYFTYRSAKFLSAHRDCRIGIINEYGERYDTV